MQKFITSLWLKRFCVGATAILLVFLYSWGALSHSRTVNLDMSRVDQSAYMRYARNLYETDYTYIGDRNRMPVYPFLQSLIYSPDLTEEQFFVRGKQFNIALSVVLLASIFFILKRCFSWFQAVNVLLITTFTIFIFKAAYFQTELLFYFLNFCSFCLMCLTLKKPSWLLGITTGVVLGIAHLTKASVLPGLLLFVVFSSLQLFYWLYQHIRDRIKQKQHSPQAHIQTTRQLVMRSLSIVLVVVCFLGTVYPYISTSKRIFGHYFYNVNSTFYIWYDSWEEAEQGTKAHGDRQHYPDMPPEEIPSLRKYLREHTPLQILDRFWNGLGTVLDVITDSYGYFKYVVIYLAIALGSTLLHFRESIRLAKKHVFLILFGLAYFVSYLLLYAWYSPIASGQRFVLAQFLPFIVTLNIIINTQAVRHPIAIIQTYKVRWLATFNLIILGMILVELHPILAHRIVTIFAGS